MADVRLTRAAVIGALAWLGACDAAGAAPDPASGLAAPAGWQSLPEVAKAAREGLGSTVTVEGVEAWGEPARGCYAVWLAVAGAGPAEKIAEDVLTGLANPVPAGSAKPLVDALVIRDVAKPIGPDGLLTLSFARGPFSGKLSARLGSGRIVTLACFANQREPASCETGCNALLGGIR